MAGLAFDFNTRISQKLILLRGSDIKEELKRTPDPKKCAIKILILRKNKVLMVIYTTKL